MPSPLTFIDASVEATEVAALKDTSGEELDAKRVEALRHALVGRLSQQDSIAHLKGLASGLATLTELQAEAFIRQLVAILKKEAITVLVWDGDDYGPESFTSVLPRLQAAMPELKLFAFLMSSEREARYGNDVGFQGSWHGRLSDLTVFMTDNEVAANNRYEHLGVLALKATAAKLVIAMGGAVIVRNEYDIMRATGVRYILFDMTRKTGVTPSIKGLAGVEVVELQSANGELSHPWATKTNSESPRPFKIAMTVTNLVGVNDVQQTFTVNLFLQMTWENRAGDAEDWVPFMEWKNVESMTEEVKSNKVTEGRTVRTSVIHATFYQSFRLCHFPFDMHRLEIVLVSDDIKKIQMSKLRDDPVKLHPAADELLHNSQWWIIRNSMGTPCAHSFEPTRADESSTGCQYSRFSARLCICRKWQSVCFNLMLPTFTLGASTFLQYAMQPPTSVDDRIGFIFTLLISVIALKLVTVNMLPPVPYLTYLDTYALLTYLFLIAVAVESGAKFYFIPNGITYIMEESVDEILLKYDFRAFCVMLGIFLAYNLIFLIMVCRARFALSKDQLEWLDQEIAASQHTTLKK